MFGMSFVYVIFEDGTDIYWARSRVLEYLQPARGQLPEGVDADARARRDRRRLGLRVRAGRRDAASTTSQSCARCRTGTSATRCERARRRRGRQRRRLRQAVPGQRRSRTKLRALRRHARRGRATRSRASNDDVGGRVWRSPATSTSSAAAATCKTPDDLEKVAARGRRGGTPVRVRDVGEVELGPDIRRGVAELDGEGEVVGRHRRHALRRERARRHRRGQGAARGDRSARCRTGVEIVPTYDRSELIERVDRTRCGTR